MGYLPNSSIEAASTGPTNAGTPCWGSPTARLIAGCPGGWTSNSSRNRTNGERMARARLGEGDHLTSSAAGMNMD